MSLSPTQGWSLSDLKRWAPTRGETVPVTTSGTKTHQHRCCSLGTPGFLGKEQAMPACLLLALLIRAGDVEENPGPRTWMCAVCSKAVTKRSGAVQCTQCTEWAHPRCAGVTISSWTPGFIAPCCTRSPSPSPPKAPKAAPAASPLEPLTILQINICGLRGKIDTVVNWMALRGITIAAVQETHLRPDATLACPPGYTIIREDRPATRGRGGGLALIIHQSVRFRVFSLPPSQDGHLEQQAIEVRQGQTSVIIGNIYCPPASSCSAGHELSLSHLLALDNTILVGDINAHHHLWHSAVARDARGNLLAQEIEDSSFAVLNEDLPTRVTSRTIGGIARAMISSPDITLATENLIMDADWKTEAALGSDHLAILVSLQREEETTTSPARTFINFRKANWEGFREDTEAAFARLAPPDDVFQGERLARRIITKAAANNIPAGRIREVRPFYPKEAADLARERDRLQRDSPGDPGIHLLTEEIAQLVTKNKRSKWCEFLDGIDLGKGAGRLWSTVKHLCGQQQAPNNQPISFADGEPVWSAKRCCEQFNRQFTPGTSTTTKEGRRTRRKIRQLPKGEMTFTEDEVTKAIKETKSSKALGPDDLAPIFLKHLGPCGIRYITAVINHSIASTKIPALWKVGRIIPLLKPGKPADKAKSYRPIALLSPLAKLVEKLLLPEVQSSIPLADHQHGFREGRSTVTALNVITHKIGEGFNKRKPCDRTVLVALDLTAAFDTVSIDVLLEDIYSTSMQPSLKRWLMAYLRGRSTYVEYQQQKSRLRKVRQGVPQGGVLSPSLFNLYMCSLPTPPANIVIVSYADDITILSSGVQPEQLGGPINIYLSELHNWLEGRNLRLSAEKSTATLFTTWNKEFRKDLNIQVAGNPLPTVSNPKVLGVTMDPSLTFAAHTTKACEKVGKRNNVLKKLAGTGWGCTKEVLLTTYKAISRSVLNYGAPIFTPSLSQSRWRDLQTKQNAALRTVTGCHLMASEDHLHHETRMLKVKEHNEMLCTQFLLGAHKEDRPDHRVTLPPPPRSRKVQPTLRSEFRGALLQHISEEELEDLDEVTYRTTLANVHRAAAERASNSYTPPVWPADGAGECKIDPSEEKLPRPTRCTLAQLRSGYSKVLNSYQHRLDSNIHDVCPKCGVGPHDVPHLLHCPTTGNPREVFTPDALWLMPVEVAGHLGLDLGGEEQSS